MDLAQLKARIEAARRVEHTLGAARFTLEVPPEQELRVLTARARAAGAEDSTSLMLAVTHAMLLGAVRGWEGVTVAHFLADGDAEAVPFEAGLVAPLMDAQPEWAAALTSVLYEKIAARKARFEAAAGN